MWTKFRSHTGFTLIELLIVISIITILVLGATAGYGNFSNRNLLKQSALTLKNNLRLAQTNALSGKRANCTRLVGYGISFTDISYTIAPICDPTVGTTYPAITYPAGITMPSPPSPMIFYVLSKGTNIQTIQPLILSGSSGTYTITVTTSGDINDGGYAP